MCIFFVLFLIFLDKSRTKGDNISGASEECLNIIPNEHETMHVSVPMSTDQVAVEAVARTVLNSNNSNTNRFATINMSAEEFIEENENENTKRKTLGHQRLFKTFLQEKQELRKIHEIAAMELNTYLSEFLLRVRQKDGKEYEPVSLRSIISSLDRYLKRHNYPTSIVRGIEFRQSMDVLSNKGKELKRQGMGNKPKASDAISDAEINHLYDNGQLGRETPSSLLNTLWMNNTLHFGMRGGSEHR